ncbi:MAG: type II secretion system F family protein [Brevinematia bacterium]
MALALFFIFQARKNEILERIILCTPFFSKNYKLEKLLKIIKSLEFLINNRVNILKSIEITASIVEESPLYKNILSGLINKIKKKESLSTAIKNEKEFTTFFIQATSIGENSGRLGELLSETSKYYDKEFETGTEKFLSLLGPVLIIITGIIIGIIVIALFLRIIQLPEIISI